MLLTNVSSDNLAAFAPLMTTEAAEMIKAGSLGAVGAVLDSTACGVLVYELWEKKRLLIHELTVTTPYRRQGIGTGLLQYFKGLALDNGLLLTCTFPDDEAGAFHALFTSSGFIVSTTESRTSFATMEELIKPSALDGLAKDSHTEQISEIGGSVWNQFRRSQSERGPRILSGCEERRVAWKDTLCLCSIQNRNVCACIIVEEYGEKDYLLSYAFASSEGKNDLAPLLATARQRLLSSAPADSCLYITAVNRASTRLVEKLLPGAKSVETYSHAEFNV